jgi:hypothetical protein
MTAPRLERTTFATSRLAEFFTERELTMQIGSAPEDWPAALRHHRHRLRKADLRRALATATTRDPRSLDEDDDVRRPRLRPVQVQRASARCPAPTALLEDLPDPLTAEEREHLAMEAEREGKPVRAEYIRRRVLTPPAHGRLEDAA